MTTTTIMTAETLRPFITPTSAENYVTTNSSAAAARHRRSCYFLAITASAFAIILTTTVLGITIWNTMRISNLQTEVQTLKNVIESMQKRLGLTYLDNLSDLENDVENNNALIDDELPEEDDDDDNDSENISGDDDEEDDDDYEDYDELMNKFRHYQETDDEEEEESDNGDSMGDDNVYNDFGKFNNSKKKKRGERKTRSVAAVKSERVDFEEKTANDRATVLGTFKHNNHKSLVAGDYERRRSPLRLHSTRRRKFPTVRSAKSVAPVTSNMMDAKPAAHFHLTHKVPYHNSAIQVHSYNGDMYIGKPSWTNELDVETYFHVENGVLTVHEPGLYYVYAQICYHNNFAQNGFIIFHGHKPFLQCLNNIYTNNVSVVNTCHTSGLIYLRHNEHLHLRDFHTNRRAFLEDTNNRSYFGLIKV